MSQLITCINLAKIGIFLNLIGTILVAFSFGKNLEEAHQINNNGKKVYLASFLYPKLFYIGLISLAIGFVLQLF